LEADRASFYLIPVNLVIIACFIISTVFTGVHLPLTLDQCKNLQPESARIFAFVEHAKGGDHEVVGCKRVFLLQTLTILIMFGTLVNLFRLAVAKLYAF
jgi:hypothetical protein